MPLTENTVKAIQYLSSIAECLSEFGNENKGESQYIAAKGDLSNLQEVINNSTELTIIQKDGMNKLIKFLSVEVDKRLKNYNNPG